MELRPLKGIAEACVAKVTAVLLWNFAPVIELTTQGSHWPP